MHDKSCDNFSENLARFQAQGFIRVNSVVDNEEAKALRKALDDAMHEQDDRWSHNPYYRDTGMVHNPMCHDPVFYKALQNSIIDRYLESILDKNYILYAYTTSSMPPFGSNFSNRIHVDCPRIIEGYRTNIGVLVALDDFTIENGATYFLPNSYSMNDQPDEESFFKYAERPLLKAGDCVIFDARTWHRGGDNTTEECRHAVTMNLCRSYMKQRFDYPRLLGDELLHTMDEKTLRILGYRTRVPATLDEYYVPPDERLYWPNQE